MVEATEATATAEVVVADHATTAAAKATSPETAQNLELNAAAEEVTGHAITVASLATCLETALTNRVMVATVATKSLASIDGEIGSGICG